jgi:hypothetical protein
VALDKESGDKGGRAYFSPLQEGVSPPGSALSALRPPTVFDGIIVDVPNRAWMREAILANFMERPPQGDAWEGSSESPRPFEPGDLLYDALEDFRQRVTRSVSSLPRRHWRAKPGPDPGFKSCPTGRFSRRPPSCSTPADSRLSRSGQYPEILMPTRSRVRSPPLPAEPTAGRTKAGQHMFLGSKPLRPGPRWATPSRLPKCRPVSPPFTASRGQVVHGVDQVPQVPAQAVEPPDDERIAEAGGEAGPVIPPAGAVSW